MDSPTSDGMPDTVRDVPNQPKTPTHNFRCPDPLWQAALLKARRNGETLTAVLNRMLEEYVEDDS